MQGALVVHRRATSKLRPSIDDQVLRNELKGGKISNLGGVSCPPLS